MAEAVNGHHAKDTLPQPSPDVLIRLKETQKDGDKTAIIQDYFLQSLSFPQMHDREHEVNSVSDKTYSWLLNNDSNFANWLSNRDEEIYWINGKPGCGKSTLMRFVSQQNITMQKLKIWTGGRPLTIASYYFWTSGTKDQRSQAGLLRSLLHQLLTTHRELMSMSIPELWLRVWEMSTKDRIKNSIVWELDELLLGLRMFFRQALQTMNIVLFVDGLDEFDGDHGKIIAIFNGLVKDSDKSLKLCVSSRSWPVFEEAYKTKPQFRLQDFTLPDITRFVLETLCSDTALASISESLPERFSSLVNKIVSKADGVFLWASLAVRFLCKTSDDLLNPDSSYSISRENFDTICKLAEDLPDELDDLFRWLVFVRGKNSALIGKIAMLLQARDQVTAFTGDQDMAIISVWDIVTATTRIPKDLLQEDDILQLWIEDTLSDVKQLDDPLVKQGVELIGTALENAAPGLLVHHRNLEDEEEDMTPSQIIAISKMTYAHRTVKDWLDQADIQQKLAQAVSEESMARSVHQQGLWLPHLTNLGICQCARRHPLLPPKKRRNINEIWPFVVLSLTHARLAAEELSKLGNPSNLFQRYVAYTSSLNTLLEYTWRKSPGKPDDTWTRNSFGSYEERMRMIFNSPWLSICTRFGLTAYVQAYLEKTSWTPRGEIPLLSHAVEFLISRKNTIYPISRLDLVRTLLLNGHSTDEPYTQAKRALTPWLFLLETLQQAVRRGWMDDAVVSKANADAQETEQQHIWKEDEVIMAPAAAKTTLQRQSEWVGIVNLFIKHGASLDATTIGWAKDPSVKAGVLLRGLKEMYHLHDLRVKANGTG